MRRAGPCPRERCAAPQARATSRRGGAVGARETADGGTFGANGAQHSRAEHRPVCQAAYDELEHARRVWVRLTQGRARTLRRTGWRHYQDLGQSYAALPGYLHGYCGRSPWRRNGARSPAYHAEPGVGQRCSRVGGRTQNHPDLHSSLSCLPGSRRRTELDDMHRVGSGAPAPRLPVTFRDEPRRLRATTHDRRLPMSRMLLRVPDGCGADRRLVIALRPQCNVSRTTAQARHDAGLSLDWASPVTWIWMAAQGATRLGRDSYRAATVEHIRTLELPGRVLRVAVRAGKPEWPPPRQPR